MWHGMFVIIICWNKAGEGVPVPGPDWQWHSSHKILRGGQICVQLLHVLSGWRRICLYQWASELAKVSPRSLIIAFMHIISKKPVIWKESFELKWCWFKMFSNSDIECSIPPLIPTHDDYKLVEDDGSISAWITHWPNRDNITKKILYNSTTLANNIPRNFNTSLT